MSVPIAARAVLTAFLLACLMSCAPHASPQATPAAAAPVTHPDFSGFWNLDARIPRDEALMKQVAPDTAFIDDTGPKELPAGDFGGLKLKPATLEATRKWNPYAYFPTNVIRASREIIHRGRTRSLPPNRPAKPIGNLEPSL
jgi:hypothetical protein